MSLVCIKLFQCSFIALYTIQCYDIYKAGCCVQRPQNIQIILIGSVNQVYVAHVQMMSVTAEIVTAKYLTSGRLFFCNVAICTDTIEAA